MGEDGRSKDEEVRESRKRYWRRLIKDTKVKLLELQLRLEECQNQLDTIDDRRQGWFANDGIDCSIERLMTA